MSPAQLVRVQNQVTKRRQNRQFASIWRIMLLNAASLLLLVRGASADPVTVSVDTGQPAAELSEKTLGLSYETSLMLPDEKGVHYFRPDNKPLIATFKMLGIKSLRIGGNSVDARQIPIPSDADVAAFFEFAKAAGVKVIYSVRLQDGDAASAGRLAKQIRDHYADALESFAIGNEPDYYKDYDVYKTKWTAIRDAMVEAFPDAKFSGPDANPKPPLIAHMVQDFGNASGRLIQITQHSYPFGCAYKNPKEANPQDPNDVSKLIPFDAAMSREKMLAPAIYDTYETIRKGMADAVAGTSISFRLTETNSFWFSGLAGASDSYASALWGVDYLHWWASHGADGINFHTGDRTGGAVNLPCAYAAFVSSAQGYEVRPLGYAIKLFDMGGHGRALPVRVSSEPKQGLVAYAALTRDRTVFVTIINKAHGVGMANTDVQLNLNSLLTTAEAQIIFLTARRDDISANDSDISLGGAPIKDDGAWLGRWTPLPAPGDHDSVMTVSMPPASAAVIKVMMH